MKLMFFILVSIPVCVLTILYLICNDYRKFRLQKCYMLLMLLILPAVTHAQYVDKDCNISFKWHENQVGKLEYTNSNLTYTFVPSENYWKIIIRNNSSDNAQVNWKKSQFIINGRASQLLLHSNDESAATIQKIKGNSEISLNCTASILANGAQRKKIYNRKEIKKGSRMAVSIIIPISVADEMQFFKTFDFIISSVK